MKDEDLTGLEKTWEGSTQGPWTRGEISMRGEALLQTPARSIQLPARDVDFIVVAHEAFPKLIDEIRRLRQIVGSDFYKETEKIRCGIEVLNELLDEYHNKWADKTCPDCDGTGTLGRALDGRLIACERCGGHEDSAGTGKISSDATREGDRG